MRRISLIIILSFCTIIQAFGQSMTDKQVLQYAARQKKAGMSETEIAANLLQRGATMAQLQQLRQQYSQQISKSGMSGNVDNAISGTENRMRINNGENAQIRQNYSDANQQQFPRMNQRQPALQPGDLDYLLESGKKVFGRDIFNNKNLTFEPQMNIATPQNYVLGPGDKLIIDVYGASQESLSLTVSPDGDITVPECGPIHVSGLTVSSAQARIKSRLGEFYSSSDIKTTVGQTRSILVNVMGEVKTPGTYTLSAFATVFHAIYMAGGINDLGTLRNIKVFRQGKLITVVDIYEYILNGRLAGNVRLQDNDVVQVGAYDCIVDIAGRVKRPMAYEMRKDESLSTLLRYSGGFASDAYKGSVRVFRKNDRMKSVFNIEEFDWANFKVADGDSVLIDSILDRYDNMVEIKGAVFHPGMYELGEKVSTVGTLVEAAAGVREEAFTKHAVMRRMKQNRTQEVLSIDLEGILNGSVPDVALQNEDVLFIPTQAEHLNLRTLTIEGEVVFPGTYEYAEGMTIEDLVLQAGGLTDAASTVKADVSRRIVNPEATESGMEISKTFSFALKNNYVVDGDKNFTLEPYDIVMIRRSPVYMSPSKVYVEGEIAFEGSYTLEAKNQRLSDIVKAAGGVMPGAYVRGARLVRTMTEDERARWQAVVKMSRQNQNSKDSILIDQLEADSTYSVGIHLDEAIANPGGDEDIELVDGDRLIVPRYNRTVRVSGDVRSTNTVAYKENKDYKYYIDQAGGFGDRAKKGKVYIVYQNGTIAKANKGKIEPGCEVIVPSKGPKKEMTTAQWIGIGSSVASLGTMFATIANLIKK
jgi:protein involved in polysaccharide export with SLBB domain